jgi:CBS domain containing-hemolysin-like protein
MDLVWLIVCSLIVAALITGLSNKISGMVLRHRIPFMNRLNFSRVTIDTFFSETQKGDNHKNNQELTIFHNALLFSKVRIRDCMIPRTEVEAVELTTNIEELLKKFVSTGYSKVIVYQNSIDNIVGYISSKELFKHPKTIKEKLNPVAFVPETMPANKLLHEFMQHHRSIAVVVDEYGGTSGIVTLEDIIEEIFGEIEDEHDTDDLVEKQVNPNEFVLSGRLEIEYMNSKYGLDFPENEDYDTLAGFILYHYHNLPKPNTIIKIELYTFKILKVSNTRIELVHLKLHQV